MVHRIGVRAKFATNFGGTFDELLQRYSTRYITLNPDAYAAFKAKLVDVAGPLDFTTNEANIKTLSGPMSKEQVSQAFNLEKDPPAVALFFDLDFWVRPESSLSDREILNKVKFFSGEVWDLHERLRSLIID